MNYTDEAMCYEDNKYMLRFFRTESYIVLSLKTTVNFINKCGVFSAMYGRKWSPIVQGPILQGQIVWGPIVLGQIVPVPDIWHVPLILTSQC